MVLKTLLSNGKTLITVILLLIKVKVSLHMVLMSTEPKLIQVSIA